MHRTQAYALAIAASIALASCSNSTNPSTVTTSANLSGDYSGTVTDAQNGSGSATGTLAQHGASVGGSISAAGTQTVQMQMSLSFESPTSLSGSIVVDFPGGGPTCTFKTHATYANNGSTTATLTGAYSAVTNCSGDTGTYSLTQQCTDTVTAKDRREPMSFPPAC